MDPIFVQNLWVLLGYALSGFITFLLVRRLTGHDGAALVAGVIFALYPYRADAYPKVQLQMTFWLPLALLLVDRLRRAPTMRDGVFLGLVIAAEVYSCLYYGMYGPILIAIVAIAAIIAVPALSRLALLRSLVVAIIVGALCVAPLIGPYRAATRVVGERSINDVRQGSSG